MSDCCNNKNPEHHDQLKRLNRIAGQVAGVQKMITENRYCTDIVMQLQSIRSAVKSVESNIIEKHLSSCVATAFESEKEREQKIKEIIKIFKKSQ